MRKFINELKSVLSEKWEGKVIERNIPTHLSNRGTGVAILLFKKDSKTEAYTIYPETLYNYHLKGMTIEQIADDVIEQVKTKANDDPGINSMLNWDSIKDKVYPIILRKEAVEKTKSNPMTELAYTETGTDLVEAYEIVLAIKPQYMCAKIPKAALESYKVSLEELREIARVNARKEYGYDIAVNKKKELLYFVLTNKYQINGSRLMFDKESLERVAKDIKSETFYMIPATINGIFIYTSKDKEEIVKEMIKKKLRECNPNDILQNEVYFYDGDTVKKE